MGSDLEEPCIYAEEFSLYLIGALSSLDGSLKLKWNTESWVQCEVEKLPLFAFNL